MSAAVREAQMMEQRMAPLHAAFVSNPGARLPYGQMRPLFRLEIARQHGAPPRAPLFRRRFCALSRFRPPSDLPGAPKESAFAFFR